MSGKGSLISLGINEGKVGEISLWSDQLLCIRVAISDSAARGGAPGAQALGAQTPCQAPCQAGSKKRECSQVAGCHEKYSEDRRLLGEAGLRRLSVPICTPLAEVGGQVQDDKASRGEAELERKLSWLGANPKCARLGHSLAAVGRRRGCPFAAGTLFKGKKWIFQAATKFVLLHKGVH